MDQITLKNFRCFRDEQTARLAPLTLLVGENSTGKTSFMAMIRALWDVAYWNRVPDFKEDPYDLGSFDESPTTGVSKVDVTRPSRRSSIKYHAEIPTISPIASVWHSAKRGPHRSRSKYGLHKRMFGSRSVTTMIYFR